MEDGKQPKAPIAGWDANFKGISSNMYYFILTKKRSAE